MAVIPQASNDRLEFFTGHLEAWSVHREVLGLSGDQVVRMVEATAAAKQARIAATEAAEAAMAATSAANMAEQAMLEVGQEVVRTIKTRAENTPETPDGPNIYALALIARPKRPGPKHRDSSERNNAVPRIRRCDARPTTHGDVVLTWTCGQGATMGAGTGMAYKIERTTNGNFDAWRVLEVVGSPGPGRRINTYTDRDAPAGVRSIEYRVTPIQRGGIGFSGPITMVQFGSTRVEGGGRAARAA